MRTITVAGGNLYQLALQYLGDATQFTRVMQANAPATGVLDPMLCGLVTLNVPSVDPNAGGGVYQPQ